MRSIRHWRPVNGRGAWYLFIGTAMTAVSLPFGTVAVKADNVLLPTLLGVLALCAAMVPAPSERPVSFAVACLSACLLAVSAVGAFWASVLDERGVEVTATVTWVRDDHGKGRHLRYVLAGPDGRRIPGELGWWPGAVMGASGNPEGRIGDRVTVLMDPEGLVDPRLPEEMTDHEGAFGAFLFFYALTTVFCMLAGRPRKARLRQRYWRGTRPAGSRASREAARHRELVRVQRRERERRWQRRKARRRDRADTAAG